MGHIVFMHFNASWRIIGPLVTLVHPDLFGVILSRDIGKTILVVSDGLWESYMPNELAHMAI